LLSAGLRAVWRDRRTPCSTDSVEWILAWAAVPWTWAWPTCVWALSISTRWTSRGARRVSPASKRPRTSVRDRASGHRGHPLLRRLPVAPDPAPAIPWLPQRLPRARRF